MKNTYYKLDIKNPYCSKENFLWKHNSDETLGQQENDKDYQEAKVKLNKLKSRVAKDNFIRKMIKEKEIYL